MEDAENEQRSYGDRFWGCDLEIKNIENERQRMEIEENINILQELYYSKVQSQNIWEQETKEEAYSNTFIKALEQVQERKKYLKTLFSTDTSQQIIDYKWSTKVKIKPLSELECPNSSNNNYNKSPDKLNSAHKSSINTIRANTSNNNNTTYKNNSNKNNYGGNNNNSSNTISKKRSPLLRLNTTESKTSIPPTTYTPKRQLLASKSAPMFRPEGPITAISQLSGRNPINTDFASDVGTSLSLVSSLVGDEEANREMFVRESNNKDVNINIHSSKNSSMNNVNRDSISRGLRDIDTKDISRNNSNINNNYIGMTSPGHDNGSLASMLKHHQEGTYDPSVAMTPVRHSVTLDGHPNYKWDQEVILKRVFHQLCAIVNIELNQSKLINTLDKPSSPTTRTTTATTPVLHLNCSEHLEFLIMSNLELRKLLQFTVYGSWIKLNLWERFTRDYTQRNIHWNDDDEPSSNLTLTLAHWLDIAKNQAGKETYVPRRLIRTYDEHRTQSSTPHDKWYDKRERLARLARVLVVGSLVWCLHGRGVVWLPAVVVAIHVHANPFSGSSGSSSSFDSSSELECFTYDLVYVMTQQSFSVAVEEQNSTAHQVTKLSATILLGNETQNNHNNNQNNQKQRVENANKEGNYLNSSMDEYDGNNIRVLNINKSHCLKSSNQEATLAKFAYDEYYNKIAEDYNYTNRLNDYIIDDHTKSYENSAIIELLFDAVLDSQITTSSESLGSMFKSVRGLDVDIWREFLATLPVPSKDTDAEKATPSSSTNKSRKFRGGRHRLEREEWVETCLTASDLVLFNSYPVLP